MSLKVYNTATRSVDEFEPLEQGRVRVYACGPTIYDHAHIGNFRSFLFFDLVHRYLEWCDYEVCFVMNLTDVDDKVIEAASRESVSLEEHTRPFGEVFLADSTVLGIRPADVYPRATKYIERMVDFIKRLVASENAYSADDGAVYFAIDSFSAYGKLKGIDTSTLKVGARVDHDEYDKEDARDFALWKAATEEDETVGAAWNSPWGRGRPGWHLECSVMSVTELGDTLDMHLGGEDLIFPHHENEIAQSEAATGQPFVRNWLHVKHLFVEGQKMSKSLGNFVTLRELLDEGYDPASIRHLLISSHYRGELNFTRQGLQASASAVQRLLDFEHRLEEVPINDLAEESQLPDLARSALDSFKMAMDNDFNSADALAAIFILVSEVNAELDLRPAVIGADRDQALNALRSMDGVLGLLEVAHTSRVVDDEVTAWVERKLEERANARANGEYAAADVIRKELEERGILVEDGPAGTRWKVVG
ncbi:MAG: cysteine--tRNA ligase [Gemmatimonadetes bacterium]|nr:cysteine--tRNA ligase [Gemmatimonadota bacterium]|tara:strand:+ start:4538 stop:5971 length:1434 start_codon:yes stop_codon:yes gene_type:complete